MSKKVLLYVYFTLFTLSGFSGLIYESIWSHYLKLFLGHAAYAQVLVLIIFMGGMALGAGWAARHCAKAKNLLLLYAVAEGLIGLFGVFFHPLFTTASDLTFSTLLPALDSSFMVNSVKWLIATLIILPQSILLGTTFVLLATGIIRKFGSSGGRHLATLYFANSLGAAIGVIANVYYIIPGAGLPGSAVLAGMINLAIAIAVWLFARTDIYPMVKTASRQLAKVDLRAFLIIAAVTGTASFIYEIVWIRMLSMVLGASTQAFEIMLSAFILGLAIGSFWVRKRIDSFRSPVVALAVIQIIMGIFATLTLPLYDRSFDLMVFVGNSLARTDNGFVMFNLASYLICVFIMLPTTICAGMTLPLLTHLLVKSSGSDSGVGRIYTANTVGSIVGILLASQLLMPLAGMKGALLTGAALDLAIGLYLYIKSAEHSRWLRLAVVTIPAGTLFLVTIAVQLDPMKMSSSVFRSGRYLNPLISQVVYYVDGKTSTVTMTEVESPQGRILSIVNNGKPDASIRYKEPGKPLLPTSDEPTMILLGALPTLLKADLKRVANIGLGSGLTAQTLLQNPTLERLDTIEIEAAVVEGARRFGERVDKVYNDPRSHIVVDDAKTYFVSHKTRYDAIISEPPNPWVSGVSSLFSTEFYRLTGRYLKDDGLFVQWMHLYEINPMLVQSIYKALRRNFEHVRLYQISAVDVALVASKSPIGAVRQAAVDIPELNQYLQYIGVKRVDDINARRLGDENILDDLLNKGRMKENSDYFPALDFGAIKARFLRQDARMLVQLHQARLVRSLENEALPQGLVLTPSSEFPFALKYNNSQQFFRLYQDLQSDFQSFDTFEFNLFSSANQLHQLLSNCQGSAKLWDFNGEQVKLLTAAEFDWLEKDQLRQIYDRLGAPECIQSLNESGQDVVFSVSSWLKQDYRALAQHSGSYLKRLDKLQSASDLQMLKFYLYAALRLNDKGNVDSYYARLTPQLRQDVELAILNNRYLDAFYPTEADRFLRLFNQAAGGGLP